MSAWEKFYSKRVNNKGYEHYFKQHYAPFLDLVRTFSSIKPEQPTSVLEVGCGTGLVTKLTYKPENNYILVDRDPGMLRLASTNLKQKIKNKCITLIAGDIKQQLFKKYGLIYSHGVLEHFEIKDCIRMINNWKAFGSKLVHYVPTNKYKTPSFGDERLLSKAQWEDSLRPTKTVAFNKGKDLVLIWEN